jgi:hypothetical protein
MLVVLAHAADWSAHWAAERLRDQSRYRVELVLVESLGDEATGWRHELGRGGGRTEIRLANGPTLRTGEVSAVLNRMLQPPLGSVARAVPGDADYARNELTAFAASWLRSLAPLVLNPPTPQGLSGRWRAPLQWRALAIQAGLPVAPATFDSTHPMRPADGATPAEASTTVLVIGGVPLVDGMPAPIREAAGRLSTQAQTQILGLRFAGADPVRAGWQLLDATPHPDLSAAGAAGITALAAVLSP